MTCDPNYLKTLTPVELAQHYYELEKDVMADIEAEEEFWRLNRYPEPTTRGDGGCHLSNFMKDNHVTEPSQPDEIRECDECGIKGEIHFERYNGGRASEHATFCDECEARLQAENKKEDEAWLHAQADALVRSEPWLGVIQKA